MPSFNLKDVILCIFEICQFSSIYFLCDKLTINCICFFIFEYKFLDPCHNFSNVDVCTINMLALLGYHIIASNGGIMGILGIGVT